MPYGFGGFYYMDYWYIVLVIPAMIIAMIAQFKVKSNYNKFSKVLNSRGITGAYAAQTILSFYGITDVRTEQVSGRLTDHYDPKAKVIRLSQGVYSASSIAAVGIACHEAGHAAQHAESYLPIKIRTSLVPVCNIGSHLGIPLAFLGLFLNVQPLVIFGLVLYGAVFLFHLVTLPVEFNASRRAMAALEGSGSFERDELSASRRVLTAAALTYVAALLVSLLQLLRPPHIRSVN